MLATAATAGKFTATRSPHIRSAPAAVDELLNLEDVVDEEEEEEEEVDENGVPVIKRPRFHEGDDVEQAMGEEENEETQEEEKEEDPEEEEIEAATSVKARISLWWQKATTKWREYALELSVVWRLAWPLSAAYFLEMAMSILCLFMLGQLSAEDLAAGSLAFSIIQVFGLSPGFGILTGLDSLAAQAWGAGQKGRVGMVALRASMIINILCIPISIIWFFTEDILLIFKQDAELASMAGHFTRWMLLGLWPTLQFEVLRRWLQAQNIVLPVTLILIFGLPVMVGTLFLFVFVFPLGFIGCPIGLSIIYWLELILLVAYLIKKRSVREFCWPEHISLRACFSGWREYLRIALPGALMGCIEGWGFELMTLIAGTMGTSQLAVYTLLLNTYYLVYMIPYGIGLATCTRIANLLGDNKPQQAKTAWRLILALNMLVEVVSGIALIALRYPLSLALTSDEEVQKVYRAYIPITSIVVIFDGAQIVAGAVLRGCNRPKLGIFVNFFAFYMVGIPIGIALAMPFGLDLQVLGLWCGIGICDALSALLFSVIISYTNWTKIAHECVLLANDDEVRTGLLQAYQETIIEESENLFVSPITEDDTGQPEQMTELTEEKIEGAEEEEEEEEGVSERTVAHLGEEEEKEQILNIEKQKKMFDV